MADWYSKKASQKKIREFHIRFARFPSAMKRASKRLRKIMEDLVSYLKSHGILERVEFTGSAFERLKVGGKELEFDVMFVLKDGKSLMVEKDLTNNLYGHLKPKNQYAVQSFSTFLENGAVSPVQVRDKFHGDLQKWLNAYEASNPSCIGQVTLKYSGPAIRANVHKLNEDRTEWFFIDLVPAYEVQNGEIYVAKPWGDDNSVWRQSFSIKEKAKLKKIDKYNGCRRMVIRILKVIRDREPGLDNMVSFYIKCLVIEMSDRGLIDWDEKNLSKRLLDVMLEMRDCMRNNLLRHPFDKSVNILQTLDPMVRQNIADRLERIATSENVAEEVFNPALAQ